MTYAATNPATGKPYTAAELQAVQASRPAPSSMASYSFILGGIGNIAGLVIAYNKQKKFWGYVGYSLLFGIIGSTSGAILGYLKDKSNK